jgi:acyl-CoA thioesterase I
VRSSASYLRLALLLALAGCGPHSSPRRQACILPLGDSITQGDATHASYRYWLWEALRERGRSFDFVGSQTENLGGNPAFANAAFDRDHEGHSGMRADQVRDLLPRALEGRFVGIALVHLGTNDILQRQAVDGTVAELGQVIDRLRAHNPYVAVLLAQAIPAAWANGEQLAVLNQRLPALIALKRSERSPIVLVDQASGFDPERDSYDGVHPNEGGEKKMAARWLRALSPLLAEAAPCGP